MRRFALLAGLIVLALALPLVLPPPRPAAPQGALPWEVERLSGGGIRVAGLMLPGATLADARHMHGPDFELALIEDAGGRRSAEAYQASARLGFITGKLILSFGLDEATLAALAKRATSGEALQSGGYRLALAAGDLAAAASWPIAAIGFIPSANLDEATVLERFGAPARRIEMAGRRHLLYPDLGLDVMLDPDGKELLQYVAPARFAVLADPLEQAGRAAPQ